MYSRSSSISAPTSTQISYPMPMASSSEMGSASGLPGTTRADGIGTPPGSAAADAVPRTAVPRAESSASKWIPSYMRSSQKAL